MRRATGGRLEDFDSRSVEASSARTRLEIVASTFARRFESW